MVSIPKWNAMRIQWKVMLTMLPSLLPMITIVTIAFQRSKAQSLQTDRQVTHLIIDSGIQAANADLNQAAMKFREWAAEDIYGLAIEFATLDQIPSQFESMGASSDQFAALLLTDTKGEILENWSRTADSGEVKGETIWPDRGEVVDRFASAFVDNPR